MAGRRQHPRCPFGAFPNYPAQWVPYHQPELPEDGYADSWIISFVIAYQFRDPERINWRLGAPIRTCLQYQDNPFAPPTFRIIWTRDEPPATRNNMLCIIKRLWGGIIHANALGSASSHLGWNVELGPKTGTAGGHGLVAEEVRLRKELALKLTPWTVHWARNFRRTTWEALPPPPERFRTDN